jgi:hypothetical protein
MGRWVIGLVAVVAALAAPSSLAQVVLAKSVFHTANLRSNAITGFAVSCPPGYVAASAGISNPASGVTLLGIRPVGIRAYTFRFGNPVTNPVQQVTVVVACRRFSLKAPTRLKVAPVKLTLTLAPGKAGSAALPCPSNTVPAGWGEAIEPVRSGQGYVLGVAARVSLRKVSMHLRGFAFSLRNNGAKAQSVTLYGTCLTALRPTGPSGERLHVKITTFRTPVNPGNQRVVERCPRTWTSLAAGYALRSPLTEIGGAAAIGTGGRWWVASDAPGQTTADLQLVCGRLR